LDGAKLALQCSDRVGNQCGLGFPGPAKLSFALQFLHHDVSLFLLTSFCVSQRRLENISQRKLEMSHKEKCRHVRTRPWNISISRVSCLGVSAPRYYARGAFDQ